MVCRTFLWIGLNMLTAVVVVLLIRAKLGCARFDEVPMPVMPRDDKELENGTMDDALLWMTPLFVVVGVFCLCGCNFCVGKYLTFSGKVTEEEVRKELKTKRGGSGEQDTKTAGGNATAPRSTVEVTGMVGTVTVGQSGGTVQVQGGQSEASTAAAGVGAAASHPVRTAVPGS